MIWCELKGADQSALIAGWNVVTTGREAAAPNYGQERHMSHADRYHRAHEFLDVVKALWDSWEDDAFLHDKARGVFFDRHKMHVPDHRGEIFSVMGPLNVARPPQGHPLIIQAGSSEAGQELAAATADVVEYLGNEELIHASVGDNDIVAIVSASHRVRPGDALNLVLPLDKVHIFEPGDHGVSLAGGSAG